MNNIPSINIISADDIKLRALVRDVAMERLIIKSARVELALRNALGSLQMLRWYAGKYRNDMFYCADGKIRVKNVPFQATQANSLPKNYVSLLDRQEKCEPQITQEFPFRNLNGTPEFKTPFIMLRLHSFAQPMPLPRDEFLEENDRPEIPSSLRLMMYDQVSVNYIASKMGITDNLVGNPDDFGTWQRAFLDMSEAGDENAELIIFRDKNGTFDYMLEWFPLGEHSVLLPVGFYQNHNFDKCYRAYIPPQPQFSLYHAEKMAQNPKATIVFTDELAIALCNESSPARVFSTFYGEDEVIPHLNVSPMSRRHVIWLVLDKPNAEDSKAKYATALKIAEQLAGHGINLEFAVYSGFEWETNYNYPSILNGEKEGVVIMTQEEFILDAMKKGFYIPEAIRISPQTNISGEELEKMKKAPFLIAPIARQGAGLAIFGGPGVAKSWLAMSIAVCAANGISVFPDRWRVTNPDGVKCLTIAGEMDKGEYGERLNRLNQHYAKDESHKKNFILHIADQLDLASQTGFNKLNEVVEDAEKNGGIPGQPVGLVILDNLTTLSVEGENPANFGRIEYALKSLKARGITVILIHHENKQGDIRGARKISDVMDMKLHLYKANVGDKIGIIVKNEKIRSGKQSEFATFKAVLDVDDEEFGWVVSQPSQEELAMIGETDEDSNEIQLKPTTKVAKTKYGLKAWEWLSDEERMSSVLEHRRLGLNNAQIAANHATSETTVCNFRKAQRIRDIDLKNNGFDLPWKEE